MNSENLMSIDGHKFRKTMEFFRANEIGIAFAFNYYKITMNNRASSISFSNIKEVNDFAEELGCIFEEIKSSKEE